MNEITDTAWQCENALNKIDHAAAIRSGVTRPRLALAILPLTLAAACAGQPEQPVQALARAEASIEQAEQSGAREQAAATLDSARDKYSKAETAARSGDTDVAGRLAVEAALDAELAAAMARNDKAQNAVEELNRSIETLRQEIARQQSGTGEME